MVQPTSAASYSNLTGISDIQSKVLDVIQLHGPITQGEAWNEHFPDDQRHTIAPRFAELEKQGLIASYGKRQCRFSHVSCMTWEVVKNPVAVPAAHVAKKNSKASREERLADFNRLDQKLQALKSLLAKGNTDGEFLASYIDDVQTLSCQIRLSLSKDGDI